MSQPVSATGVFRGGWNTGTAYNVGDTVVYAGAVYVASTAHVSGATFDGAKFTGVSTAPYATASRTASFTATAGAAYLVDTTAGAVTATLPAANVAGQSLAVKLAAGANPVNLAVTGSDTIGGAATASITLLGEVWQLTSSGSGQWNVTGGNKTLPSLNNRFAQVDPASLLAGRTALTIAAHRGGGGANNGYRGPYPEETREAFSASLAAGVRWFNPHARMLADGALVLMHDTTPDRTTDATGAVLVSNYTTPSWKKLKVTPANVAAGKWVGYGVDWGEIHPPFVTEYLDQFGTRACHVIECISANTTAQPNGSVSTALVAALAARGLTGSAILQSFSTAELVYPVSQGLETMYLAPDLGTGGSDAASIVAAASWAAGKPKHVGINAFPAGQTQAQVVTYIGTLTAAGLTVWAYTVTRRYERDWLVAAGVAGILADEPVYLAGNGRTNAGTVDPLGLGVWPHGLLQADLSKGRGILTNGGVQLDSIAGGASTQFVCYGGFSPPASLTAYTVQADFVWDQLDADGTRHMDMMVCCPDDRPTTATIGSGFGVVDGYQVVFRQNASSMVVSRCSQSAQTITGLLTQSTGLPPAATAGVVTTMKVQVTPTQISVSLIQAATTYGPFTVTDSTYRGGYFHLGKAYNNVTRLLGTWKNVSCA